MIFKFFIQKKKYFALFFVFFLHTCMYRYRKVFAVTELWATGQETVFTQKQEIVRFKKNKNKTALRGMWWLLLS